MHHSVSKSLLNIIIAMVIINCPTAFAQSSLPQCTGSHGSSWHSCYGTTRLADGSVYQGEFRYGKYEGKGKYVGKDGSSYEGDFAESNYHGWGSYTYATNGHKLTGWWQGGKYLGKYAKGSNAPSRNEISMNRSMNSSAVYSACSIATNSACYSILDTALFTYKNRSTKWSQAPGSEICIPYIGLHDLREFFIEFYPTQPGMHSASAEEFLHFYIFAVLSCNQINRR